LQGLAVDIYSSPLPRASETANIIRREVIKDIYSLLPVQVEDNPIQLSCPIHIEESLTNPEKYLESYWRRRKSRSRLSTMILDMNTKPMVEFLENLDSPSMESTSLLITHGHNANIINELLENFFYKHEISSKRTSMNYGAICVYFLQ
jgi:broad specificity phosphatase PhoE